MEKTYFKILISDLTEEILNKSTVKNPYKTQRTIDGKYSLLSFKENTIPLTLFKLGYIPMSITEVKQELQNSEWDPDTQSQLISNNNSIEVVTQYEKNNVTLKICHNYDKTDTNGDVTIYFKIPGIYGIDPSRIIKSGEAWFENIHQDDKVTTIDVIDIDNVTGLGSGALLKAYNDVDESNYQQGGWRIPIHTGICKLETIGFYGTLPAGLYMRIKAKKGGTSLANYSFYINIKWGEIELY